jgi:integrase/recombinase XerD
MASLNLFLDKRRKSKQGTYPIKFKLIHNRKWVVFETGYAVNENEWVNESISANCKSVTNPKRINIELKSDLYQYAKKIEEIKLNDPDFYSYSALQLKNVLLNHSEKLTFAEYANDLINEMEKAGRFGNARIYRDTVSFVLRCADTNQLYFNEIDYNFLIKAHNSFLSKNKSDAGFNVYARTLRAIFNKAIKSGVAKAEWYPFTNFKIKKPNKKRLIAITGLEISKIESYKAKPDSIGELAKNVFLFSFYTRGMNLADIAKLKPDNIISGRLFYKRSKTGTDFSIPLNDKAVSIINRYKGSNPIGYLFPIIMRKTPDAAYKDLRTKLGLINRKIKLIGKELGIEINLTTYSARHSFVGIAKKEYHVSTDALKEALGHSNYAVTEFYLGRLLDDELDDAFKGMM